MKDVILYAYSTDSGFLEWLQFLLTKVEAKVSVCSSEQQLKQLYADANPDILLIDDYDSNIGDNVKDDTTLEDSRVDSTHKVITFMDYLSRNKRGASMVFVLSAHVKKLEYRVNLLLNGADYIIEKPINMVELIARITAMIRHQKHVYEHITKQIYQTQSMSNFDSMERVLEYVNNHIKPTIQKFIDSSALVQSTDEQVISYLEQVRDGSIEIMAAINAIRDDVHELMTKDSGQTNSLDHLDELFEKNLALINVAYTHRKKNT